VHPSRPQLMPGTVLAARATMCLQVAFTVFTTVLLLPPDLYPFLDESVKFALLDGLATVVITGVLIVKMDTRRTWVRWTTIVIQCLYIANGLMMATNLSLTAAIELALAVALAILLLLSSSAAWFDVDPTVQRPEPKDTAETS
jgi:hypothetical protein